MPTPPYAKVLVSINGGGLVSGGQAATGGQTLQFSGESTVNWRAQRWEIYDYPPGFATPASWTLEAVTGIIYSTSVTPALVTLPATTAANWGKYAIRLRVNDNPLAYNSDGSLNTSFTGSLTDEGTIVSVHAVASGAEGVSANETTQYDTSNLPQRSWAGAVMRSLRSHETILAASATPSGTGIAHVVAGAFASPATLIVDADVNAAAAIAGTKVSPNFGAQNVVTTGYLSVGSTPSGSGIVRLPGGATTQLAARNNANAADITLLHTDTGDNLYVGDAANATDVILATVGSIFFQTSGTNMMFMSAQQLRWASGIATPSFIQDTTSAGSGTSSTLQAQSSSFAGGSGGSYNIQGGAKNGAGLRGGVRIQLNATTETMLEAAEVVSGNRVLAIGFLGNLTSTQMPANTGDGVVFFANRTTAPTANSVGGGIDYAEAGAKLWRGTAGTTTTVAPP